MIAGAAVGLTFDAYRAVRRWWGWGPILTFLADIIFSVCALGWLLYFFNKANALSFRFYMLWGSLLGLSLYLWIVSSWVMRGLFFGFRGLSYLRRLLIKLLKIPFWGLRVVMEPPYQLLRWFSLWIFRLSEALILWPVKKMAGKVVLGLKGLFFPGTNG
ncbi:MAG: spore cortex biosynthesis protein YabQ [Peptococcaceae bacterium]|nr:spore cortex biosynthesis protein YabQ [Peptococcaceae bacterium]